MEHDPLNQFRSDEDSTTPIQEPDEYFDDPLSVEEESLLDKNLSNDELAQFISDPSVSESAAMKGFTKLLKQHPLPEDLEYILNNTKHSTVLKKVKEHLEKLQNSN